MICNVLPSLAGYHGTVKSRLENNNHDKDPSIYMKSQLLPPSEVRVRGLVLKLVDLRVASFFRGRAMGL